MQSIHDPFAKAILVAFSVLGLMPEAGRPQEPKKPNHAPKTVARSIATLAFTKDNKFLFSGSSKGDQPGMLSCWDLARQKAIWEAKQIGGVTSIGIHPGTKFIAVACGEKHAILFDQESGKRLREVGEHGSVIRSVAFLSGRELLATGGPEWIKLWETDTGKEKGKLKGEFKQVLDLRASPDGNWLLSSDGDHLWLWDLKKREEVKGIFSIDRGSPDMVADFVGNDQVLAVDNNWCFRVIDLSDRKEYLKFRAQIGARRMTYSRSAGRVACTYYSSNLISMLELSFREATNAEKMQIDKLIKDFDNDSYEVRESATKSIIEIGSIAESFLRTTMTEGSSAEVRMRARESRKTILGKRVLSIETPFVEVSTITFSSDGKWIAGGSPDGEIGVWETKSGKELAKFTISDK